MKNQGEKIDQRGQEQDVTPEEILTWRVRLLGFLFLIGAILSVLIGIGIATAGEQFDVWAVVCFSVFGAFLFKARNGVLSFEPGGRRWGVAASVVILVGFPIGTVVGIYGLLTLRKAKSLYGFDLARSGGFRIDVESQDEREVPARDWEFSQFIEAAKRELQDKTHAHRKVWEIEKCSWSIDQGTCSITFNHPDGRSAVGPVQVIGTLNDNDKTWMWAWNNSSIAQELRKHSETTRNYGIEKRIGELTTPKISCDADKAWDLASVACSLNRANGVYRAPVGDTIAFVTFGELRFSKS